jgi:multidrug efflux pump subunit AcrB
LLKNKLFTEFPHASKLSAVLLPEFGYIFSRVIRVLQFTWRTLTFALSFQILVQNAFQGIAIGLCLSLIVLIVATTNVYVGLLATIIIAMITSSVLGIITLIGWKLGVLESLNLTLVVGLAVDYVVHLAEGYMELTQENRLVKVKHTLGHVGISVFSGACTTLGASIFMLAAKIVFFFKFGIFIFCTVSFSIFFSLFLFTALLSLIGPENDHGSLLPLVRRFYDYLRGKTSRHVDCNTCRGKGFSLKIATEDVNDVNECGVENSAF